MSKMIPSVLSPDIKSNAEKKIFRWFQEAPGTDDWIVLHSLGIANHKKLIHGEVDFFVIAPGYGIFALEVKGGRVKREGGAWSFTDRYGQTSVKYRSPFDQAWEGIYSVLDSIKKHVDIEHAYLNSIVYGTGVLFPDIQYESVGADEEPWQVFDCRDGKDIAGFIKRIGLGARRVWLEKKGRVSTNNLPTKEDALYLLSILRGDFDFVPSLSLQIDNIRQSLISLTREQYKCIDQLDENPRCLVRGSAGTGKTLLAVAEAKKSVSKGERTALFCYNNLLGKWLNDYFSKQPENLRPVYVGTFHKYMTDILKKYRIPLAIRNNSDLYYEIELPKFITGLLKGTGSEFDRVIIDEAQDIIKEEYLNCLDACLLDGLSGGKWMMFGDLNMQSIYATDKSENDLIKRLESRAQFIRYRLSINCRNTRNVCEEIKTVVGVADQQIHHESIEGPPVQYITYKTRIDQEEKLKEVLENLIENQVQPGDITILSPRKRDKSVVRRLKETYIANYEFPKPDKITFSTIHGFKGLENKVIILTDIENMYDKKILYVGLSRATAVLYVIETEEANKQYVELFIRRRLGND